MFSHEMEQNEWSSNLTAVIFVRWCTLPSIEHIRLWMFRETVRLIRERSSLFADFASQLTPWASYQLRCPSLHAAEWSLGGRGSLRSRAAFLSAGHLAWCISPCTVWCITRFWLAGGWQPGHVTGQTTADRSRWRSVVYLWNYVNVDRKWHLTGADPGGLGRAPTPGTEGPAPKARVPSSQGQKEGTLVSLECLFNAIQA